MDELARLLDDALAAGLGSAAALSVGDAGVEVGRLLRGQTRRLPDPGVASVPRIDTRDATRGGVNPLAPPAGRGRERPLLIDEVTPFDLASLTKPMATAALAMVLVGDGALDLDAPIRRW
ncbi:MAG TPA: serine hydrolase, partial [Kofleriaceae bacterium]